MPVLFPWFQAIEALLAAVRSRPVPQLFMLLGNTQIKAKQFREAITSFGSALELYVRIEIGRKWCEYTTGNMVKNIHYISKLSNSIIILVN